MERICIVNNIELEIDKLKLNDFTTRFFINIWLWSHMFIKQTTVWKYTRKICPLCVFSKGAPLVMLAACVALLSDCFYMNVYLSFLNTHHVLIYADNNIISIYTTMNAMNTNVDT